MMTFPTVIVNTTLECVVCIVTPIDLLYSHLVFLSVRSGVKHRL